MVELARFWLDGEAIVPGFSMAVAELFEEWDF